MQPLQPVSIRSVISLLHIWFIKAFSVLANSSVGTVANVQRLVFLEVHSQ